MSTRFFTNLGEQTLFNKFRGVFESNPDIEWFDALVGYLRSSGYFALRPYLEKVPHIRILVGINVDAIMADYHRRGLLFLADPTKALEEFRNWLRNDIQSAEYKRDIETGILQFVDDVISKKIELRAHPTRRLHAKLYIFRPKGFNEHKPGAVITGSSNLTAAGIGVEEQVSNYEFNVLLHDFDDVQFATGEFENLWKESVEILPKFLKEVRDSTYLAAQVTPYELYYKLLLDLTTLATRRAMGVTLAELGAEDWRKLQAAGKESFTQAIGRAVAAVGGSGLLARSAAVNRGVNVVIFPGVCASDRLEVVEGAKLEKLGVKTRS